MSRKTSNKPGISFAPDTTDNGLFCIRSLKCSERSITSTDLDGTSGLSFEAKADTTATARKRQIREKITNDRNEAKNILKKLLMFILYSFKSKRFILPILEPLYQPAFWQFELQLKIWKLFKLENLLIEVN